MCFGFLVNLFYVMFLGGGFVWVDVVMKCGEFVVMLVFVGM